MIGSLAQLCSWTPVFQESYLDTPHCQRLFDPARLRCKRGLHCAEGSMMSSWLRPKSLRLLLARLAAPSHQHLLACRHLSKCLDKETATATAQGSSRLAVKSPPKRPALPVCRTVPTHPPLHPLQTLTAARLTTSRQCPRHRPWWVQAGRCGKGHWARPLVHMQPRLHVLRLLMRPALPTLLNARLMQHW
jgi:hypothetical protein